MYRPQLGHFMLLITTLGFLIGLNNSCGGTVNYDTD